MLAQAEKSTVCRAEIIVGTGWRGKSIYAATPAVFV
jgi:hypothetical protein